MDLFESSKRLSRQTPAPRSRRRMGSVVSVQTGYTCTVNIAGLTTSIENVRYFAHVAPRPGELVWIDTDGYDMIVTGVVAGNGGAVPMCRVYRNSAQSIATSTITSISFNTEVDDPWNMWASGTPTVITAPLDGVYVCNATAIFAASNLGTYREANIEIDGTVRARQRPTVTYSNSQSTWLNVSMIATLVKGGTIGLSVAHDTGSALNAATVTQFPYLAVTYLGPAA